MTNAVTARGLTYDILSCTETLPAAIMRHTYNKGGIYKGHTIGLLYLPDVSLHCGIPKDQTPPAYTQHLCSWQTSLAY